MTSVSEEDKEKHAQLLVLPPNGSEFYIGGLPKDASVADMADLCKLIAEIYEIRLVKDKESSESKGYAFVSFKSEEVAQKGKGRLAQLTVQGLVKNQKLFANILTPTTNAEDHDVPVTPEEVNPFFSKIELLTVMGDY